jgi:O-antigen ligase
MDVINAFLFRLRYQTEGGSGTLSRVIDSIFGYEISSISLFGSGIGTRHQSAIALGLNQSWVENETVRWSAEIGLLGLVILLIRQIWITYLAVNLLFNGDRFDYIGPMIFVALGPFLISGISTQPTIQGMSAIMLIFLIFRKEIQTNRETSNELL